MVSNRVYNNRIVEWNGIHVHGQYIKTLNSQFYHNMILESQVRLAQSGCWLGAGGQRLYRCTIGIIWLSLEAVIELFYSIEVVITHYTTGINVSYCWYRCLDPIHYYSFCLAVNAFLGIWVWIKGLRIWVRIKGSRMFKFLPRWVIMGRAKTFPHQNLAMIISERFFINMGIDGKSYEPLIKQSQMLEGNCTHSIAKQSI